MDPYGAQYDDQPPYERAMYAGADLSAGFDPLAGAVWVPDPPPQPLRLPQAQPDLYYYDHQGTQYQQQYDTQMYPPRSQILPPTPAHSFQSSHRQPQSHAQPLQYRPYEMHPMPQHQQQYLPPTPALTTTRYTEGLGESQRYGDPNSKRRRVDDDDFAAVAIAAGVGAPENAAGPGPLAQAVHPADDYFRLPVASSPPRSHGVGLQGPRPGPLAGALEAQPDLAAQAQAMARRRASAPIAASSWPTLERQVAAQVATRRPSAASSTGTAGFQLSAAVPGTAVHVTSTPPLIPSSIATTTASRPAQLFLSSASIAPSVSPTVTAEALDSVSTGPSNFAQRPNPAAVVRTTREEEHRPVEPSPTPSTLTAKGQTQISKSEKSCKACRIRKVRCSRTWPVCTRCTEKELDCHYGNLIPIDLVKGLHPDSRVAELEARIKMLEHEILMRDASPRAPRGFSTHTRASSTSMFSSPMPPATASPTAPHRPSPLRTDSSESQPRAAPPTFSLLISAPPREDFSRTVYGVFVSPFWGALTEPGDSTGARKRHVDAVVASVHERATRLGAARRARQPSGAAQEERIIGATQGRLGLSEAACPGKPGHGVLAGASLEEDLLEEMARADAARVAELVELDIEELAQNKDWTRMAIWAVLDAHWATCSSNVPTIRPFHVPMRQARMYTQIDALAPSGRCILLAFCAIGVRSTPYVSLFGLAGGPSLGRDGQAITEAMEEEDAHLGLKRELVARSLRDAMIELYGRLEIAYGEATKDALEASLILALVQMWNELKPRYSRSLIRNAVAQYKELFDSAAGLPSEEAVKAERTDLLMMYALPLLHIDSTTAAYLRAAPIFTDADLDVYLAPFKIPLLGRFDAKDGPGEMDLRDQMRTWIDVDAVGDANHVQHIMGSMVIYRWLSACLRWCAQMSCPQARHAPLPPAALEALFEHLSVIHGTIQLIQYHLTHIDGAAHPDCLAPAPDGDTADHIHLRWLTRLDRETDDATWLVFSIVSERLVREEAEGQETDFHHFVKMEDERLDVGWLQACESRVRKGFKLAAFYFNFFTMSPDPHQSHHLACSLELIPNWTFLATQRYVSSGTSPRPTPHSSGLRSKADELTETELDWIERGLELARKYHPVAERRLVEIRSYRLAEKKRMELLAAEGVVVPTSRAGPMASPRLGQKSPLSFQLAMKRAFNQTVPSWA